MKAILLCFTLTVLTFSASIPCVQYQASKLGTASDCSIERVDENTLSWGVQVNFKANYDWNDKSYYNNLGDMGSPRLPIFADNSQCVTKTGSYASGQAVILNCTQSFSVIPVGYSNLITAFDDSDFPLGFSTKIPLSSTGNLQQ